MAGVPPKYTPGEIKEEEIIRMPDMKGEIQELLEVEELILPIDAIKSGHIPDFRENLKKIKSMKCRDDDVFLCAYMRSGTHWVWEIANMLTTGKLEYLTKPKESVMLEFHYPEEFDDVPSRRILNTHLPARLLPQEVSDKKLKVLLVQRNPKDVLVSSFHFIKKSQTFPFKGDFKEFFTLFCTIGVLVNWFDYTLEFEDVVKNQNMDIHVIYYEELKRNPVPVITKMSEFLGADRDDKYIQQVADMCTFKGMKKANEEIKDNSKYNWEANMMAGHYRKGEVGDWKNYFTVDQSEEFDAIYKDKMKNSSLNFEYSPAL